MHPRSVARLILIAAAFIAPMLTAPATAAARPDEYMSIGARGPAGQVAGTWGDRTDHEALRPAPDVVVGRDGELFLGQELDFACAYGGDGFDTLLRRLARVADMIADSGRRVVFTVAPGKSLVLGHALVNKTLPRAECTASGLRHQRHALDHFDDPYYLPIRRALQQRSTQVYWKADPHWTTAGGSVFSQRLATRMSPRLGHLQRYVPSDESLIGQLTRMLGEETVEHAPGVEPAPGRVDVEVVPGSLDWVGFPYLVYQHSWTATPATQTRPGKTLVLGDSFSLLDLDNLRPLFRSGRFLWVGHVTDDQVLSAILESRTVVIEQYHLGLLHSPILRPRFQRRLRAALSTR